MIPADGRFNWSVNQLIQNPWGSGLLPVFRRDDANRVGGYHDLEYIPWSFNSQGGNDPVHFTEDPKTYLPVLDVKYAGDGKESFKLGYNEIFSPFSNPNSQNIDGNSSPWGFKLNSLSNGVYSLDLFINTALNAPPSKPVGLKVSVVDSWITLNWDANIETDMRFLGKYKIYRAASRNNVEPTQYNYLATISAFNYKVPITTWIDYNVSPGGNGDRLWYKISALDNAQTESVLSESDWINYDPYIFPKRKSLSLNNEYCISNNYPNPFNPTTSILYSIKEKGFVQIKVFDILGKEIALLVNEEKEQGQYSVQFNGDNLPSATYFYVISVNGKNFYNKMVLQK